MALNAQHVRWVIAAISLRACMLEKTPSVLRPRCVKSCLKPALILQPPALRSRALFQAQAPIFIAAGKRFVSMQTETNHKRLSAAKPQPKYSPPRRGGVARQLDRSWRAGREAR